MYLFPCTKQQHLREALAKSTRKKTEVKNLVLLATLFRQALRTLALTCVHSGQICAEVKGFTVWPPNPSQRKLSDVH